MKPKTVGVLTTSRADYGIYLPLLEVLNDRADFDLKLIVCGTHLSSYHGYTINDIKKDGFPIAYSISSMLLNDDENAIATSKALTMMKFAAFWQDHKNDFEIVLCLGDRYEMFAAVFAGLPFGIIFGHIHGGETTLGAIDNVYRHSISLASTYHFTSTEEYSKKVIEITGSDRVYTIGALSLDNLKTLHLQSEKEMFEKWKIDFSLPSILITLHPETVEPEKNIDHVQVCKNVFRELSKRFQLVFTMPNADTYGSMYRNLALQLQQEFPDRVKVVENFGTRGYFSAMKLSKFVLGNTSSGIIESASLNKFVINLGNRQKGRLVSDNVIHCQFVDAEILRTVDHVAAMGTFVGKNIYDHGGATEKIIQVLKDI